MSRQQNCTETKLANFHHIKHNKDMKVVEKDKVISGMLRDERKRCEEMINSLEKSISSLPKGVINKRIKRYKDREYSYFSLKYREGQKVINRHIPEGEIKELREKLNQRKKYEKEIRSYQAKIAYLNKVLVVGKRKGHGKKSQK